MKIPRSAIHFLVVLEAIAMVAVIALSIIHPWTAKPKNDTGGNNNTQIADDHDVEENTENTIGSADEYGEPEVVFSETVLAKVDAMTLEQKVAQMFIITPEALTETDRVNVAGNATKNAINQYPVGGLVYSSINFQGKAQTINLLKGVQDYYTAQFQMPMFLMIAERGGEESSPLATTNRYTIEASPAEVGASGDTQAAIDVATNISTYLKEAGFNMNLAPDAASYSEDTSIASMMVAETVSVYGQNDIRTVMSMFPGESIVFQTGIDAGVDGIMVGNDTDATLTGDESMPCCTSDRVARYLRANMQYKGILIADVSAGESAVDSIKAGMDMVYCPANFKEAYQGVLDAVNQGVIAEDDIDEAVARILTCKEQ